MASRFATPDSDSKELKLCSSDIILCTGTNVRGFYGWISKAEHDSWIWKIMLRSRIMPTWNTFQKSA